MADVVMDGAAVEVSKPESVEMDVAKVVDEEIDGGAKGLKRKLEDAVPEDPVKSNGTHEGDEKNGHNEKTVKNGTKNGEEVKDSPVKKSKTEETPDVAAAADEKVVIAEASVADAKSTEESKEVAAVVEEVTKGEEGAVDAKTETAPAVVIEEKAAEDAEESPAAVVEPVVDEPAADKKAVEEESATKAEEVVAADEKKAETTEVADAEPAPTTTTE
jgi:hypothetical protein